LLKNSLVADQRDPRLFLHFRPRRRNQETCAPVVVGAEWPKLLA
jgi:hypothetical protein